MELAAETLPVEVCVHRWLIDSPQGNSSHGCCRLCGATREFPEDLRPKSAYNRLKQR